MKSRKTRRRASARLPLLAAVSGICGLASGSASALEIGEIDIQSQLGQPLRASISYALNANEEIHNYCIFLRSGVQADGIPMLTRARIRITDNAILLTGNTPIREPMQVLQLSVNCPYTPRLNRNFTLLFNPASTATSQAVANLAPARPRSNIARAETRPGIALPEPGPQVSGPRTTVNQAPVANASRYQVQPGDTLTGIVARIEGRTGALMPFADTIFAANPDAFIDSDKNLLKAGSWLELPDATGVVAVAPADIASEQTYLAENEAADSFAEETDAAAASMDAYTGYSATETLESEPSAFDSGFATDSRQPETASETPMFPDEDYGDLVANDPEPAVAPADAEPAETINEMVPGDVIIADETPLQAADETSTDAPVAAAEATPAPAKRSVPVVASAPSDSSGSSWTWLIWAGGASIGFLLGLALFSRRIRERFGATPAPAEPPTETALEDTAIDLTANQKMAPDVDFQFDEPPVSQPEIELDADLGDGSGLQGSSDIDVAQDFGFSADADLSADMDLELPEATLEDEEPPSTDIIPPHRAEEVSILESEVPPSEDGTEYDLSMIVDATKQRIGETEQTARDLMAVPLDAASDDEPTAENYTLSQETDFKVLEQDYEEELSATQALNVEIARAAIEIAEQMDVTTVADFDSDSPTGNFADIPVDLGVELPGAPDDDITTEMTANVAAFDDAVNDEIGSLDATEVASLDETGITELDVTEIADLDDTTINEELPEEMRALANEPTVEMEIEGGRVNTKKNAG